MVGGSADPAFDVKFREFLMEPGTQEVIAADQAKELGVMRKIDAMEKLEELQGAHASPLKPPRHHPASATACAHCALHTAMRLSTRPPASCTPTLRCLHAHVARPRCSGAQASGSSWRSQCRSWTRRRSG